MAKRNALNLFKQILYFHFRLLTLKKNLQIYIVVPRSKLSRISTVYLL